MKATGIVRRIDDLGRQIILKKYSPIGEMTTFAKQYAESLAQVSGHAALITDRDQFIATAGGYKHLIGKMLSP